MANTDPIHFWHVEAPDCPHQQADWDDGMDLEQVSCTRVPEHLRGGKRTTDLKIVLRTTELHDFIWFDYGGECIIQDRVLQLLRDHHVSGFEVRPVDARFEGSNKVPPTLWEVVVTGWAGMARPQSGILLDASAGCLECGYLHYTGLSKPKELVDRSCWEGGDFFILWPMPRYIFVTAHVITIVRDHQLTGTRHTPVAELAKTDGFTPGRLHYYMPDDRAWKLGKPLGIY